MLVNPVSASALRKIAEPAPPAGKDVQAGRDTIDTLKARSTLVGLVEPLSMAGGLAVNAGDTFSSVGTLASSLVHGDMGVAGDAMSHLVDRAFHPEGILGVTYRGGMAAEAVVGGLVGGLEIREGIKNKDSYLAWMGGADLLGSAASAATAVGSPAVGMGLSIACSAAKVALVARRPDQYSRVQKVATLFDAGGSISSAMLRAGVMVVPALVANALLGPTKMLYMNWDAFRARADRAIDWVVDHVHRSPHQGTSEAAPSQGERA